MARRGWTNKPCPICQSTRGRGTDQVCQECKVVYAAGQRLLMAENASVDKMLVVRLPHSHWESHPWTHTREYNSGVDDKLAAAWHALVLSLTKSPGTRIDGEVPAFITNKKALWGHDKESGYAPEESFYLADRDIWSSINEFDRINRIALETCYLQGLTEGLNLLMQLHAGTESPSDFSDKEAKLEKRLAELKAMVQPKKSE